MKKSDLKTFVKTLQKLTDDRFKFNLYKTPSDSIGIMMFFCDKHVSTSYTLKDELTALNALDVLIDLIKYAELKSDHTYFEKVGVSFEIYSNQLNGKSYYLFRKNEASKWVNISQPLAKYILSQNDIDVDGLYDNYVSYCQYDCYYQITIKS